MVSDFGSSWCSRPEISCEKPSVARFGADGLEFEAAAADFGAWPFRRGQQGEGDLGVRVDSARA